MRRRSRPARGRAPEGEPVQRASLRPFGDPAPASTQRSAEGELTESPLASYLSRRAVAGSGQVQRLPIFWQGPVIRDPWPKDDPQHILETRTMDASLRAILVEELTGKDDGLLGRIQEDWEAAVPNLDALFAIGAEIAGLEAIDANDLTLEQTQEAANLLRRLHQASASLVRLDGEDEGGGGDQILKDTIRGLLIRAETVFSRSPFRDDVDLAATIPEELGISPEDIQHEEVEAYRNDIRQMGVWGGLAEADLGARYLGVQTAIFTLDTEDNYRQVIRIGAGGHGGGRALLHRGNHYEVVQGAVEGQPHIPAHIVEVTETDGNCLFEGLGIVRTRRKLPEKARNALTQRIRDAVAHDLHPDQIRLTLLQILLYGENAGLGEETRTALAQRLPPPSQVEKELLAHNVAADKYQKYLGFYQEAWKADPSSAHARKFFELLQGLEVTGGVGKNGVSGAFAKGSPPEGIFLPQIWDGNKMGIKFKIAATFDPERTQGIGKKYYIGEYRQYVRGYFETNGVRAAHILYAGKQMSAADFLEDGNGPQPAYGHREKPGSHDKYHSDEENNQGSYIGTDAPSIPVDPGETVKIWLDFIGELVEVEVDGSKRNITSVIAHREWSVRGQATCARRGEIVIEPLEEPKKRASGSTESTSAAPSSSSGKKKPQRGKR